jgi:hypothetical protein
MVSLGQKHNLENRNFQDALGAVGISSHNRLESIGFVQRVQAWDVQCRQILTSNFGPHHGWLAAPGGHKRPGAGVMRQRFDHQPDL